MRSHRLSIIALLTLLLSATTSASFLERYFQQFAFDDLPPQPLSPSDTSIRQSAPQNAAPPPSPFTPATPTCSVTPHNPLVDSLRLRKRQSDACASGYASCADTAGSSGLCCPSSAICSADAMGSVGCCPQGAACTGTVGPLSTSPPSSTFPSASAAGGVTTSTAPNDGVIIGAGGQTVQASVASNNQQSTSTSMMTGPAVLTGSDGQITATVSQSGFVSGETVFAAAAPGGWVERGGWGWWEGWAVVGAIGALGL